VSNARTTAHGLEAVHDLGIGGFAQCSGQVCQEVAPSRCLHGLDGGLRAGIKMDFRGGVNANGADGNACAA